MAPDQQETDDVLPALDNDIPAPQSFDPPMQEILELHEPLIGHLEAHELDDGMSAGDFGGDDPDHGH